MILIGFEELFKDEQIKYPDNILIIDENSFMKAEINSLSVYPYNLLEFLKTNFDKFDILFIKYSTKLIKFIEAIKLPFSFIYKINDDIPEEVRKSDNGKFIINENFTMSDFLKQYNWYIYDVSIVKDTLMNEDTPKIVEHKQKTLQDLIEDDSYLTDADIQDLKVLQSKLKMGVLLQAKSMLKRVLQLTTILDKLYDELLVRIEDSITTTDTASLMYTTDYISKALKDTNEFIVSLVNNEKIQNLFIIDNSTVINTGNDTFDIDKRERIRKAAEIILNNYDNLAENRIDLLVNPNKDNI